MRLIDRTLDLAASPIAEAHAWLAHRTSDRPLLDGSQAAPSYPTAPQIAARIADELDQQIGGSVGYSVRFDNKTNDKTSIKVMTDGILLAELANDPDLLAYDVIIVDEAHERSLNIDFLLGYLHRLLPRRPDLHVVVTSATIDTGKIAAHFDDAPIIEVSGRNYPVEIRYRPLDAEGEKLEVPTAVRRAITELTREGPGDILVFSSGERLLSSPVPSKSTLKATKPLTLSLALRCVRSNVSVCALKQTRA